MRSLTPAVCLGAHARRVGTHKDFAVCQQDESAQPLLASLPGSTAVCNAIYANQKDREATITLLRGGTVIATTRFPLTEPLAQVQFERPSNADTNPLAPGAYTCRFTIDGGETVEKMFTVAPPRPDPLPDGPSGDPNAQTLMRPGGQPDGLDRG